MNCLFLAKPWADLVAFTDIDDMLLPADPLTIRPSINLEILRVSLRSPRPIRFRNCLTNIHKQDPFFSNTETPSSPSLHPGFVLSCLYLIQSFLFNQIQDISTLDNFDFGFLLNSKTKQNCNVWRMKTRVVVNASELSSSPEDVAHLPGRVDSVNMHETGIHRFGYVQTRIPCTKVGLSLTRITTLIRLISTISVTPTVPSPHPPQLT